MTLKLYYPLMLLAILSGCESADSTQSTEGEVALSGQRLAVSKSDKTYTSLRAGTPGCFERVPLCKVLRRPGTTYGVYRVKALTGRSEQTPQGDHRAVTFVTLERLGGPGPQAPVARIRGGPLPDGSDAPGPVSLTVNEVVGLVLHKPALSQWYTFSTPDLFRKTRPRAFGSAYEEVSGSEAEFLAKLDQEFQRGCPPPRPTPPSPDGQPAVVTDVVDEEVVGTSVSL